MTLRSGRWTARFDEPYVVFIIGMRINRLWKIHRWWPVATAMPRMLRELKARPELGYLGGRTWAGRTFVQIQYWRSFEALEAYAKARDLEHMPAWTAFNRARKGGDDVGVVRGAGHEGLKALGRVGRGGGGQEQVAAVEGGAAVRRRERERGVEGGGGVGEAGQGLQRDAEVGVGVGDVEGPARRRGGQGDGRLVEVLRLGPPRRCLQRHGQIVGGARTAEGELPGLPMRRDRPCDETQLRAASRPKARSPSRLPRALKTLPLKTKRAKEEIAA